MSQELLQQIWSLILSFLLLLSSMASSTPTSPPVESNPPNVETTVTTQRTSNSYGYIDTTEALNGCFTICYTKDSDVKLRCHVIGPTSDENANYSYVLTTGKPAVIPLTQGDGVYRLQLCEQNEGTNYWVRLETSYTLHLSDPLAPWRASTTYIPWKSSPVTTAAAALICQNYNTDTEKIKAINTFITQLLSYDHDKANIVTGIDPDLPDDILTNQKGICIDYAVLMAAMCRAQNIPCKLVIGQIGAGENAPEHAWVEAYTVTDGFVRYDPTFHDGLTEKQYQAYVTDDENYVPHTYH